MRQQGASRRRPRQAILVFGEDLTDINSIRELIVHFRPDFEGIVRPAREPVSLTRSALNPAVQKWVDKLNSVITSAQAGGEDVLAAVVHRDADAVDDAGVLEQSLREDLTNISVSVVAAVPVVSIESWWLLHAEATESLRPIIWRNVLPRASRNQDSVTAPKKDLKSRTAKTGYEYSETDGPAIAARIRSGRTAVCGTSPSLERFRQAVLSI